MSTSWFIFPVQVSATLIIQSLTLLLLLLPFGQSCWRVHTPPSATLDGWRHPVYFASMAGLHMHPAPSVSDLTANIVMNINLGTLCYVLLAHVLFALVDLRSACGHTEELSKISPQLRASSRSKWRVRSC